MNAAELEQRLLAAGCSPHNFSIKQRGSDVFCLVYEDGLWRVFYTERGRDDPAFFESSDEAEACGFYFEYITTQMRHDHLVGFFRAQAAADALGERLRQHGLQVHQDKIPYGGWPDPRYRVFVVGQDVFKARALVGEIPQQD